jgi:hypothetical protein
LASCNKDDNDPNTPEPPTSCSANSGSFDVTILGNDYQMVIDAETHFSILYNWYSPLQTDFILDAKDQNGNSLDVESQIDGPFIEGQSDYENAYFDLDVDTFNLQVSAISYDVIKSDLNEGEGIYYPIKATFTATAHSSPTFANPNPTDSYALIGSFCLNGVILQ